MFPLYGPYVKVKFFSLTNREEVKRVPYHLIRTFSYQPILLPTSPFSQYQYGRGLLQPPNIPSTLQNTQQPQYTTTSQPKTSPTTPVPTTKSTTRATTTTTTTEKPTTAAWQEVQNRYGAESGNSPRIAHKSTPFNERYDFSQHLPSNLQDLQQPSQFTRSPKDPLNLQYVTNIAPMNVQVSYPPN